MADIRVPLAAERASRRITHPNAAYSKLRCNLCKTIIKSESAWQAHLHSTTHALRVSREHESASRGPNKKRKGIDSSPDASDQRKRAKADDNGGRWEVLADLPLGMEDEAEKLAGLATMARGNKCTRARCNAENLGRVQSSAEQNASGDDDELAGFERELAEV
ncbi:hypothetical protein LTR22_027978 [Elasticomyces elasticus]|nr:hypothetical protein LTR22_027978 [Elasticomyces elasticus]KAK4898331.1 hypothetical protein LTR49_027820 [Elasticomyces elasticus]